MNTHTSRFDAKGRMSIPAPFRAVMCALAVTEEPLALVLMPSPKHPCIDAYPPASFERYAEQLRQLDGLSADEEDLAATLFGDTRQVEPDKEGRISLDAELVQHAGLTDAVACMGLGDKFQLWEPQAAQQRKAAARQGVNTRGLVLPGGRR